MKDTANRKSRPVSFVGGGNMAQAILEGLLQRQVLTAEQVLVIEPHEPTRAHLQSRYGVLAHASAADAVQLPRSALVIWAIKPQSFREAAQQAGPHCAAQALHLSIAAGVATTSITRWLGTQRVVRAMPNTPALIGKGMTGLYATAAVNEAERAQITHILAVTGQLRWFTTEADLDAVTALSGCGPAYVFYFLEALVQAGAEMGLDPAQARELAVQTFIGGAALAADSTEALSTLRARVTSKGGATHAALTHMEQNALRDTVVQAMHAARSRAVELGREFA